MIEAKFFIGGHFLDSQSRQQVVNKHSNDVIGSFPIADDELVSMAIAAGSEAQKALETFPAQKRSNVLDSISRQLGEKESQLAETIAIEAGKPIKQALAEVRRARQTFKFAAALAGDIHGASVPLDAAIGSESKYGFFIRVPAGIVAAISPFNFPLNLVAHKVAPAIAAGCPVILKPASYTPLTAFMLAEIISKTDLPPGAFNLLYGPGNTVGMGLVKSNDIRVITFTGSPEVGLEISRQAGIKRLILELGSNSAAIVDKSADLNFAVPALVFGAFAYAGQVCISVQRIYVAQEIYDDFLQAFSLQTRMLVCGNPVDEKTDIGPMISESDAIRVEAWVNEATFTGAKIVVGGGRQGQYHAPTILIDTKPEMKVVNREIFGPVVCIEPFREFRDAIDMVNDSEFGLQAGVFSKNIDHINQAIHNLQVGGVIINDAPTYRADNMPYGGVKMSGLGREGVKFAIEEMTDIRMIAIQR
ncbi:MAG TPA: aldehyde dehydrogenase [candidate division Zixibacteria bacterium]|nr:aldehyde dehydrogenase [candidate division Zixibacteria bacterium]